MNVVFDYQVFYFQRYGGISRYFYELANELDQINGCHPKIVVPYNANDYIDQAKRKRFIMTFNPLMKKLHHNRFHLSDREEINREYAQRLSTKKNTVLHETYYNNRIITKAPRVTTVHDMIYEYFHTNLAGELDIIRLKKKAVEEADIVIAVSENTKKDLLHFYPEVKNKTHVVYHGVSTVNLKNVTAYKSSKPFILHVGHRGWYKNFDLLLKVFCEEKIISDTFDLICFGGGNITDAEAAVIKKFNKESSVHFISGGDDILNSLYRSAAALVYISNYEGFGMPVLEAMSFCCPVLCSNTSSLPEVAGNAALSIDPKNEHEFLKALHAILFNSELKQNLILAGTERAGQFTWKKCAQETFELYKTLV